MYEKSSSDATETGKNQTLQLILWFHITKWWHLKTLAYIYHVVAITSFFLDKKRG